ncbi:bis(5'-nucleosyl)-tetraphosphatase (symmetrical) YqeK [Clostridium cadaveris]|uniref:bis(5'-nucleosyl)-tetraphosphatase (symmetrical) YqeK n=1 Tax=Clostridium cadaveris TaxID=1529 RepID=UPI000C07F00B|nr:bis(5'-nucleosyl)-tetraphosphatase (symmetrical) YqeK [Clostridium cadaveris]
MWNEEMIKDYLKKHLKESRYKHVLGVVETSEKLAEIYGADKNKARFAALIHDLAKGRSDEDLIKITGENGYDICYEERRSPQLLHGLVAAIIAKNEMGIEDNEILNAAAFHTTGKANMTLLEKIVYIADYIEPNRDFPGVKKLREITFHNLDKGVLQGFDNTIKFVIDRKEILHLKTIEARNYLLQEVIKGDTGE